MKFANEFEMSEEELRSEVNTLRNQLTLLQTQYENLEKLFLSKVEKDKLELRRHRESLMAVIYMDSKREYEEYIYKLRQSYANGPRPSFEKWLIDKIKRIEEASKEMEEKNEGKT